MKDTILVGFMDELEKIAASKGSARHMQTRQGTRPIRFSTLLANENRESVTQDTDLEQPEPPTNANEEDAGGGDGGAVKMAKLLTKERKEKAIGAFAKARPYVAGGVSAGVPLGFLGNIMGGKKTARTLGVLGAAAGVTNEALKDWAEKNKRKRVAKRLLED